MYDYLIVGSGLYGAVCAYELNKRGFSVLVIEKRPHIGGNIYTEDVEGIAVHKYGAHIFHTSNKHVWDYVNALVPFHGFINSPIAVYKDELYNLPFNMNTFSKLWGIKTPAEAKAMIEKERKERYVENPANLEEQAINLVGTTIYEKLIKGYTEKQWGKPCDKLPAFIIKRLPVRFTYDNNYFNDVYQGIPTGGYTQLAEKLLSGVEVRTGCDYFADRAYFDGCARNVIYTGQIDRFFDYEFGALEYRSVRFETEILDTDNYQGNAVVNYTAADVPYTRIIEHRHFDSSTKSAKTVISREYSQAWKPDTEPYYPVNNGENGALYEKYKKKAEALKGVYFGGRLGLYRYMDMDDTVEAALNFVNSLN